MSDPTEARTAREIQVAHGERGPLGCLDSAGAGIIAGIRAAVARHISSGPLTDVVTLMAIRPAPAGGAR
jgi:hypothetical protein